MIIDSHCHPQFSQYDKDREEMIRRAFDGGVSMICVGTDYETSKQGIELAQKHEGMWATVGLHPNDVEKQYDIMIYHTMIQKSERVVAIGEVGLDYYRTTEPQKQRRQKEVFEQFLDLATKYDKPVILHSRDAGKGSTGKVHSDMVSIIENWKLKIGNSALRVVAHSFTGNIDDAKKYLELGFYLGFNGIITFPPSRKATAGTVSGMYDEVVKYVPLENILLETDAPFLAPELYRGKRNEPAYVIEVARKIAELKNESLDKVIEQTTLNCKTLFRLNL